MKFTINKLGYRDKETPPIPKAKKGTCTKIDARSVARPEDIPLHKNKSTDWWYKHGINHRVVDGHIRRDLVSERWFIEINTLEELLQLQQKYGDLTLTIYNLNYCDEKRLSIYIDQMD